MTPQRALAYLASLNESRIEPGLERIREALARLGDPHRLYPHILVAGTNGKGSVVAMAGAAFAAAGLNAGRFTSPHLHRFNERIVTGGGQLTEAQLPALVAEVRATGVALTYFEFATAMALLHFCREGVDVALLEVGLGGRWDATNVTDPFLSVITGVDLDHRRWLGETVEQVADHKAPVMRAGRPLIVGPVPPGAEKVILEAAAAGEAETVLFGREFDAAWEPGGRTMVYRGRSWKLEGLAPGLPGRFQTGNAACALAALETMAGSGWPLDTGDAVRGVREAVWPGRFHWVAGLPPVLVDAAHNPSAARALVDSMDGAVHVVWLFSALSDKDMEGMASEMARLGSRIVLVPLDHPRAAAMEEMARRLPEGFSVKTASTVAAGLETATQWAGKDGTVVVAGSVVLAGKVLEILEGNPKSKI